MPKSSNRVFTQDELAIAATRSVDALADALAAGDRAGALEFSKRLRREVLAMRGNYDSWETALGAEIESRGGPAAAAEAWKRANRDADEFTAGAPTSDEADRWRETAAVIRAAIENGDDDTATRESRTLHDGALAYHDRGLARVSSLLSWIGREHGADAVEDALGKVMQSGMLGEAGFRERAEMLMHFTRVHLQPFELQEDDEKLTFVCSVCPSAGRLLQAGRYEGENADLQIAGPRPLTYDRPELPAYCCHEPVMEKASIRDTGAPLFIVDPSERLGEEPCRTYLYKDPAEIPERFYTRLGMEKPPRGR
jgi:hypothetical protein